MALTCVRVRLPQLGSLRAATFVLCPNTGAWKSARACSLCKDLVAEDGLHVLCWQDAFGSSKRISELVEPSLVCVESHETASDVERLLLAVPDASVAVVIDEGQPVGLIARDSVSGSPPDALARALMSPSLVSMLETASADDALRALAGEIDQIVVMSAGRVLGVVTSSSAMTWAARQAAIGRVPEKEKD